MATYDCSMLAARPVVDSMSSRTRICSPRTVRLEHSHFRQVAMLLLELYVIILYKVIRRRVCVLSSHSMAVKLLALSADELVVFRAEAPVMASLRMPLST